MNSYYIRRGPHTRYRERWLAEPTPIIHRTGWDTFATVMTWLGFATIVALAIVMALMILRGM